MRLDLFLKASRLCPRRSSAQKLCDAGAVFVNGRPAKSAHTIKPDDELLLRRGRSITRLRVRSIPSTKQTSKQEAADLIDVLEEQEEPESL
jgi:ribosomal 50S subunit-recycling heat shock protein